MVKYGFLLFGVDEICIVRNTAAPSFAGRLVHKNNTSERQTQPENHGRKKLTPNFLTKEKPELLAGARIGVRTFSVKGVTKSHWFGANGGPTFGFKGRCRIYSDKLFSRQRSALIHSLIVLLFPFSIAMKILSMEANYLLPMAQS